MSSFAFGFSGDDIDDGAAVDSDVPGESSEKAQENDYIFTPQSHSLQSLLTSLPSHISFGHLNIPVRAGEVQLPRRELFDVRAQLMAEDTGGNDDLISGLDTGDLRKGVYEGGLKTWECSLDLAKVILEGDSDIFPPATIGKDLHCVELGAGTAVASMALLTSYLARPEAERPASLHLTICDYNEAVLRLVSLPNILLAWQTRQTDVAEEGEFEIDDHCLQEFNTSMEQHRVRLDFISGSWGSTLTQMVLQSEQTMATQYRLVLASETIYSPASITSFVQTLDKIIGSGSNAQALVAAKKIYFGVGGGVDEFCRHLSGRGLGHRTLLDVKDSGVGRVVLSVKQISS